MKNIHVNKNFIKEGDPYYYFSSQCLIFLCEKKNANLRTGISITDSDISTIFSFQR